MAFWVRENNLSLTDQNTKSVVVLMHEGWSSRGHLVNQNTKRPPINRKSMALHIQYLRCQVLSCSTEGFGCLVGFKELSEAKISKFNISLFIRKHILRLEISMINLVGMQVAKGK